MGSEFAPGSPPETAMQKLNPSDLFSLEQYARERPAFRARVIEHKKRRQVAVGPNTTWCFEDRLTIQYQVQEMLRTERIFEPEGIADELGAYNPLIPDGSNWKVTLLVEFTDPEERRVRLGQLKGIEDRCWVQVADFARVLAIADEDLERENDDKTSSVHFLRFELSHPMIAMLRAGARLAMGIDHPTYRHSVDSVPDPIRSALLADFS
jgi:Protein of unknown function (DUF3501)